MEDRTAMGLPREVEPARVELLKGVEEEEEDEGRALPFRRDDGRRFEEKEPLERGGGWANPLNRLGGWEGPTGEEEGGTNTAERRDSGDALPFGEDTAGRVMVLFLSLRAARAS